MNDCRKQNRQPTVGLSTQQLINLIETSVDSLCARGSRVLARETLAELTRRLDLEDSDATALAREAHRIEHGAKPVIGSHLLTDLAAGRGQLLHFQPTAGAERPSPDES